MKKILIPVDFSLHAMSAARTGCFIARKNNATIHLIHIVRAPEDWEILTELQQSRNAELEKKITEAEVHLTKFSHFPIFDSMDVVPRIYGGVPYKIILEYAKAYKIDLIVMGAHGSNESSLMFIGSTTQKIIRSSPCPVLSVKKNFKPVSFNRILYASDFSEPGIKSCLEIVSQFAESIQSKLDFAYINTPAEFTDSITIEKRLEALQDIIDPKKHKLFVHNDYYKDTGIMNLSRKIKTNILAIATHNRSNKKNYQIGITETLLFKSDMPVLSIIL